MDQRLDSTQQEVVAADDASPAAVEQHKQGAVDEAMAVYERNFARDPGNMAALRYLSLARFQLGNREQGLECL